MNSRRRAQMSLVERPLDDPELVALLVRREDARQQLEPYRLAYKGLTEQAKSLIEGRELPDGEYRCGPFLIRITQTEGREVSFELASKRRIRIERPE